MNERFISWSLVAASAITFGLAAAGAPAAVRLPIGLVTMAVAPGWLLLSRAGVTKPAVELLTLAVGVSLAVTVVLSLVLFLTGFGVTAVSTTAALVVTNTALGLVRGPGSRIVAWEPRQLVIAVTVGMFAICLGVATLEIAPKAPSANRGPLAIALGAPTWSGGSRHVDLELLNRGRQNLQVTARAGRQEIAQWRIGPGSGPDPWRATVKVPAAATGQRLVVVVLRVDKRGLVVGRPLREASVSP